MGVDVGVGVGVGEEVENDTVREIRSLRGKRNMITEKRSRRRRRSSNMFISIY